MCPPKEHNPFSIKPLSMRLMSLPDETVIGSK